VWIETLLVVGAAALALPNGEREAFALGALAASSLWFSALGWGARLLAPWLARPAVLRALALASAAMMAGMALRLLPVWRAAGTGVL
jgi:L-lysine exporter family protein LysE/ArgO